MMGKATSVPEPGRAKLWVQVDLTLNHVSQLIPDQMTQKLSIFPWGEKRGWALHTENEMFLQKLFFVLKKFAVLLKTRVLQW